MIVVNAIPGVLGIYILLFVRESPAWQSHERNDQDDANKDSLLSPKFLRITIVGIVLATVPLIGGWGSANWMMPWAHNVDPSIAANVGIARSLTSIVGSLFAGLIAVQLGRRAVYFMTSLGALIVAQYAFRFSSPEQGDFLIWVAVLGLFNGLYFGWLPFFLPELFPTRIRATGAGVTFNYGRILTAVTLFATGYLMSTFESDFARIGQFTSFVFLFGMIAILFAPDTSKRDIAL